MKFENAYRQITENIRKIIKPKEYGIIHINRDNNVECKKITYVHINLKERIAILIKENESYFIDNIVGSTIDTILHNDYDFLERLRTGGHSNRIAVDNFRKYGIFMYTIDLFTYVHAPINVKFNLKNLIEEYGLEKVSEEMILFLKENYPDRFKIGIVCTP